MISVAHALGGNLLATVMLRDLAGARARARFLCGTKRKGKALARFVLLAAREFHQLHVLVINNGTGTGM